MTFSRHASARLDGAPPADLIRRCAARMREADLAIEETTSGLSVVLPRARAALSRDPAGLSMSVEAEDVATLHQVREYLLFLLDRLSPSASERMVWTGEIMRDAAPPNLHVATVRSSRRVAPRFLRVEADCLGA